MQAPEDQVRRLLAVVGDTRHGEAVLGEEVIGGLSKSGHLVLLSEWVLMPRAERQHLAQRNPVSRRLAGQASAVTTTAAA
jgi:hypothetical protein